MSNSEDKLEESLKRLEGTELRRRLLSASTFIAGWEIMEQQVVDGVKGFYCNGFNENGLTYSNEYGESVLTLDKHVFTASVKWLIQNKAIDADDFDLFQALRKHRNELAHELTKILLDPSHDVDLRLLREMQRVLVKIGNFWGRIEVETGSDLEVDKIDFDGIRSVPSILFDYLIDIAQAGG